jgi:hypothetical protein
MPTQLLQVGERQQHCAIVPQCFAALDCPDVYLQPCYGFMYKSSLMIVLYAPTRYSMVVCCKPSAALPLLLYVL